MNKQEVISKLKLAIPKNNIDDYQRGEAAGLNFALLLLAELDEPEKPVLTKAEAEWVEGLKEEQERRPFWTKYSALYFITRCGFGYGFSYDHNGREIELKHYPHETHVEKERLANAILYGYEIEKEKLYLASFRDTNQYLGWNEKLGEWFISCSPFTSGVEQTQETWEGVGIWNNPAFEIKEVEE